jgi:hypothetical protein
LSTPLAQNNILNSAVKSDKSELGKRNHVVSNATEFSKPLGQPDLNVVFCEALNPKRLCSGVQMTNQTLNGYSKDKILHETI